MTNISADMREVWSNSSNNTRARLGIIALWPRKSGSPARERTNPLTTDRESKLTAARTPYCCAGALLSAESSNPHGHCSP